MTDDSDDGDDGVLVSSDTMYDQSFTDQIAARLDAIGVLIQRTETVSDPELRALGKAALEKAVRGIPTGRSAKLHVMK